MRRGITQAQVDAAADALVAAGERPTVERIRARLGTGSPNTVVRMLDAWRASLAHRMREVINLPEVPAEAGQAFAELWRLAVAHADSIAKASLASEQQALLSRETLLTEERETWSAALTEAQALAHSAVQARDVADLRLTDLQRLVDQQTSALNELNRDRGAWQLRAEQLAHALEAHKIRAASDLEAQMTHVRAVEDRSHAEVDRAREETKSFEATLRRREREMADGAKRLDAVIVSARAAEQLAAERGARATALEEQLARMDGLPAALVAAQLALAAATKREMALRVKLTGRPAKATDKRLAKK